MERAEKSKEKGLQQGLTKFVMHEKGNFAYWLLASWIQEECEKETEVPASNSEVHLGASTPSKRTNFFFSKHANLFRHREESEAQQSSESMAEIKSYKRNEKTCPILAKIAQRFFSAPATSQPSEQLFSVARDVFDYRRSRLKAGNAEILIFLNKNLPLLGFEYYVC